MTPSDLITRALKKSGVIGVGQTAGTDDLNDALCDLNDMFGQWQRRRWLVIDLVEVVFGSVGKQSYTVGPDVGNDIVMARPDQLESAFFRLSPGSTFPVDYPLEVLSSREDYNEITLKAQQGPSALVYYDPAYPNGNLLVWPTPVGNGSTEFHLFFKNNEFMTLSLTDTINLPPEYNEAMLYNLACRLRPSYQLPPDPTVVALAVSSLATIRHTNAQIPELDLPGTLPGQRGYGMNIPLGGTLSIGGTGASAGGVFRVDISKLDGPDELL